MLEMIETVWVIPCKESQDGSYNLGNCFKYLRGQSGFKGYPQSDAYSGYNFADRDDGIVRVGFMAHARRKFSDIIKISKTDGLAHEAIKYFKALYKIENEAREENASPSYRFALRNEKQSQY